MQLFYVLAFVSVMAGTTFAAPSTDVYTRAQGPSRVAVRELEEALERRQKRVSLSQSLPRPSFSFSFSPVLELAAATGATVFGQSAPAPAPWHWLGAPAYAIKATEIRYLTLVPHSCIGDHGSS